MGTLRVYALLASNNNGSLGHEPEFK